MVCKYYINYNLKFVFLRQLAVSNKPMLEQNTEIRFQLKEKVYNIALQTFKAF